MSTPNQPGGTVGQSRPRFVNRSRPGSVALETTLLLHGVPKADAPGIAEQMRASVKAEGGIATFIGIYAGIPVVGLSESELRDLMGAASVHKANTANLGVLMHRRTHGATTVSTTMELASLAGVRVFATGGLGGVHRGYGEQLDISADLAALTRFPVAVVTSGVKSLLDVESTREALETLGIPVVGFQTDRFPAFYMRESRAKVDATFEDPTDLAAYIRSELSRTGRGVVVANPIPASDEIHRHAWEQWMALAEAAAGQAGVQGRDVTPFILARLHEFSGGATLRANIALALANTRLAAKLAVGVAALAAR